MTERSATVRVNVTGNASAELGKLARAETAVTAGARAADAAIRKESTAADAVGAKSREAAAKVDALGKATSAAATAAKDAQGKLNAVAQAATAAGNAAKAATTAMGAVGRAPGATSALSVWQRLATAVRGAAASAREFARAAPRANLTAGMNGGRFAAGLSALGGFALDQSRQMAGTLGIAGRDQLAGQYVDNDVRIARLSAQMHISDAETARLRSDVTGAARTGMVDPAQILSIIETGQNRFSAPEFFRQSAGQIARFSTATGSDAESVTGLVGEMQRQMGVQAADVGSLLGSLQATSEKGSVEASTIAGTMAPSIGAYHALTGQGGTSGAANFFGLAQTLGASGGDPTTLMQNFLAKASSADVQGNLRAAGVNATDANGHMNVESLIAQMATNRRFVGADGSINQTALQGVIGRDMEANTAFRTLIAEQLAGRSIGSIASSSAADGTATVDTAIRRIEGSAAGDVLKARTNASANFMENGDQLVRSMTAIAAASSNVETRFPMLSQATDTLRGGFGHLTGTLGALNLAGMGTAAQTAANSGAAAATLSTRLGAAGAAAGVFAATVQGTLSILDVAMRNGVLGDRLQHEGGSASQDFADFFAGNWSLGGDAANSGTREEIQARVRAAAASRQANGGNTNPAAAATDGTSAIVGATNSQTQAIVTGLRNVQNAVANSPAGRPADAPP